ncbi:MAG: alpha-amylase family glycosyl hydrolase [Ilumatobacteraceae bacterium]
MVDVEVRVAAPSATSVRLLVFAGGDLDAAPFPARVVDLERSGDEWVGAVPEGSVYGLVAEGDGPRFEPSKVLLDPRAVEVVFASTHDRRRAAVRDAPHVGPLTVARHPAAARPARRSTRPPIVYEAHVRGLTRATGSPKAGTYAAIVDQLPRLAELGVTVLELLPVHQQDPAEGSYWGYMPLAFGAVHRQWAADGDAAAELAAVVAAAHGHDLEVWLDVVFNHTTEVDAAGPTYSLRGLADAAAYRLRPDGSYIETTGCGNDLDAESPLAQDLVLWSLDRLADLGVDGFRFDLASVLARSEVLVERVEQWARRRGVVLVAEPWDAVGTYQLGRAWPGGVGWRQWNDQFRDDVRGFLRGEPGLAPALRQRVQGSPDLFDAPMQSVNFVTCHDGFTLYDLVAYDHKHNEANGWGGTDGTSDNRSWNCGWEGDDAAPADVRALRHRQLRNAWCLLAMAHGVPMFAMGDELGRTQLGNNNPYNKDDETSWVDWTRAAHFNDLQRFVRLLLALRSRHPALSQTGWWDRHAARFVELPAEGRAMAWCVDDLLVFANAWWEPIEVELDALGAGPWCRIVDTSRPAPDDIVDQTAAPVPVGGRYVVDARTTIILERRPTE